MSEGRARAVLSNLTGQDVEGTLSLDLLDPAGKMLKSVEAGVKCAGNAAAEGPEVEVVEDALLARLAMSAGGVGASSDLQWLRPVEVEDLPKTTLETRWLDEFIVEVVNAGEGVARMVSVRDAKASPLLWTDNFFDLLPGETKRLSGTALPGLEAVHRRVLHVAATNAETVICR
jgi:hypothetical protein